MGIRAVVEAEHGVLLVAGNDVIVVSGRKVGPEAWLLSVQHDGEVLAPHLRVGLDAHRTQYRGGHVVGGGVVVATLARALTLRVPDKEDGVGELGVERPGDLARVTVLAEGMTVV